MARWQDYDEKQDALQENDELLINSGGIVKRIKAKKFKGEKGDKGLTGDKGEPFRFNDFSPEQLQSIKGEKGDAFEYSDFTEEQLEALRGPQGIQGETGEKGDPGEKGETGETGPQGPPGRDGTGTGDMLKSENLSGLSNVEEARENLEVLHKNEVVKTDEINKNKVFHFKNDGHGDRNFILERNDDTWWSKNRLQFKRGRGTNYNPTPIQNGDVIGVIGFIGNDDINYGSIDVTKEGDKGKMLISNSDVIFNDNGKGEVFFGNPLKFKDKVKGQYNMLFSAVVGIPATGAQHLHILGDYVKGGNRTGKVTNYFGFNSEIDDYVFMSKRDGTNREIFRITEVIPPNSDLNNYRTPGFYYQNSTANARTIANVPLGQQSQAFGMIVYEASGVIQELTFYDLSYKFIRRFYANNWSTWKEIPMFTKHGHLNIIGSVPVGSSNTGFALHGNRLKAFRNNHEIFWADAEWCEFTAYPTVNKPQSHYGHSLTRKDYVDNLVNSGGGIKVMWKKENINSNSSYQEFTHNLNIQEQDFYNGKYSVVGFFYKDYRQQVLGLSSGNVSQFTIWGDSYPSSETQFSLHTNKIYLRKGSYFGTLKSILIFKNY